MAIDLVKRGLPHSSPLKDADAFSAFYERTHLNVFRYASAILGGQTDAEDVTAEAYMRAWKARDSFSGDEDAAKGWLFTITRNCIFDRGRRQSTKQPALPMDDAIADTLADAGPTIDDVLVTSEQREEVFALVRALPEPQREILVLRYVMDWRVNQIAAHLSLTENAVSVHIHRAVQRLQRSLLPAQEVTHD